MEIMLVNNRIQKSLPFLIVASLSRLVATLSFVPLFSMLYDISPVSLFVYFVALALAYSRLLEARFAALPFVGSIIGAAIVSLVIMTETFEINYILMLYDYYVYIALIYFLFFFLSLLLVEAGYLVLWHVFKIKLFVVVSLTSIASWIMLFFGPAWMYWISFQVLQVLSSILLIIAVGLAFRKVTLAVSKVPEIGRGAGSPPKGPLPPPPRDRDTTIAGPRIELEDYYDDTTRVYKSAEGDKGERGNN